MASIQEAKELICELCATYYTQGWVSGTGGGMSIKVTSGADVGTIVMAPSGVPKERMQPSDMFVLDAAGNVKEAPAARPPPYKPPKLTECAPLFQSAFDLRGAGAVLHSHSTNAVLATMLDERSTQFHVTQLEMIKGIAGHGFYDDCVVPIIENTARECELTDRLQAAIRAYPKASAVLVRRHGIYVWGPNWVAAKSQAECYDYLFESAIKLRSLGIDAAKPPANPLPQPAAANGHAANGDEPAAKRAKTAQLPAAVVLDIEGTVAPISYVTEVLFPYAAERLQSHLEATYDSADTQKDIQLFRDQAGASVPAAGGDRAAIIAAVVAAAQGDMAADRKTTALKALQGHIWHGGFTSGALQAKLYPDVAPALARWAGLGIKTYIYSSGSRAAQRDLFGHTADGDLRLQLSGFFDTSSGPKASGPHLESLSIKLVDAAKQAGTIKRIVPSEYGLAIEQLDDSIVPALVQGLFNAKKAVRKAVEASGIEYTYLVTDAFADFWLPGLGSAALSSPPDPLRVFGDGNVPVSYASLHDIGVAVAHAVDDPRAANKSLFVTIGTATQNELLAAWERITGKQLSSRTAVSSEDLDAAISEALSAGDIGPAFNASFEQLINISAGSSGTSKDGPTYANATELYPDVKFETVEEYLKKVAVAAGASSSV